MKDYDYMKDNIKTEHEKSKMIGIVKVVSCTGDIAVANSDLAIENAFGDDYIFRRTGINNRYYKAKDKSFLDLAIASINKLLSDTGISSSDVAALICASTTFEKHAPSLACEILNYIDPNMSNENCFALDINAACSGYLYALSIAKQQLISMNDNRKFAIVLTNEVFSDYLGTSPSSDILFGDASSATLLEISNKVESTWKAILHNFHLGSTRDKKNSIEVFSENGIGKMSMNGFFVFENAVKSMSYSIDQLLKLTGLDLTDIELLIPHQANVKIIESISRKKGIEPSKFYVNIEKYGNTGASSIPLCLSVMFNQSKDQKAISGLKTVLTAFGAGFTYGSALIEIIVPISE